MREKSFTVNTRGFNCEACLILLIICRILVSSLTLDYASTPTRPCKVIHIARLPVLLVVSWTGKIKYFSVRVRAWEFGLARRARQSRPASACSSTYSGWIWCILTGFLPSSAAGPIYLFRTAIRHRVTPEFIRSRNWVPMAFTAESPPARGQQTSR